MIRTPPADPDRCDITALHASISRPSTLRGERRALYQLAVELLHNDHVGRELDSDVIDSPLARNHIGDALAGRRSLVRAELVGISAVADADIGLHDLPVASRPEANTLLAEALNTVWSELDNQQAAYSPPVVLTAADQDQFTSALATLTAGVTLARSVNPELITDLLDHVSLIGIVDPQRAGRLVSASSRFFPGLVLLQTPSSIDVAEALVHEGAHQKLFDLAITHDLFSADSDQCPPFHPPWAPKDHRWPIEQTLAAFHAYACLARFGRDAGVAAGTVAAGADSLLPVANTRCKTIGQWLLDKGEFLGTDAHSLLESLLGRRPSTAAVAECGPAAPATDYVVDAALLEFRHCGSDRVLVGRRSLPPQLYWISEEAVQLLQLLEYKPVNELIDTFAQRWRLTRSDAHHRLATLLADLSASGLVTAKARRPCR